MIWKAPSSWKELTGRKITILEEIQTSIGVYKKLWKGTFVSTVRHQSVCLSFFETKEKIPYIRDMVDDKYLSSATLVAPNAYQIGSIKISPGQTVFPFNYASIERIDNKSLYSIYGYDIEKWPRFALQAFFTRRFRTKLAQCSKGQDVDLQHGWFVNTIYSITCLRTMRNSPQKEEQDNSASYKRGKELRKLFNI